MNIYIVNCFDTYGHRVDMLCRAFMETGYNVRVVLSDYSHISKGKRPHKKEGYIYLNTIPYRRNLSFKRIFSHMDFSEKAYRCLKQRVTGSDLLWVLLPPNILASKMAALKSEIPDLLLIFDIIDLWPESLPAGAVKNMFPFKVWAGLRNRNIRQADYLVTECDMYAERLSGYLKGVCFKTLYPSRDRNRYVPWVCLHSQDVVWRIGICINGR